MMIPFGPFRLLVPLTPAVPLLLIGLFFFASVLSVEEDAVKLENGKKRGFVISSSFCSPKA